MKRRDFIASSLLAGVIANSFDFEAFAQSTDDKPKAITNKIDKKPIKPFYLEPDKGAPKIPDLKIRFEQTNNQFAAAEFHFPPKTMGPAPHVHKDLDEVMRVTKGTASVLIGNEVYQVEEGGWLMRPHDIVHTFWNATDEPLSFIDLFPNQNFDLFLVEAVKTLNQLIGEGIDPVSTAGQRRLDVITTEWGVVMYHDQRQGIMDKYGLK
ncbi:cupin domain-containing protein [Pedobacter immunditicola]|uniref:cupin domain-containing protein n=1 Tax=Pedobacter immunditicola TaxID=3133440 RepID=UPI0030AE4ACA